MDRIPYTTPNDEFMFASIGRLTISWAFIEIALDHMVHFIHHDIGGKSVQKVMPWALGRKVQYLRKCFRKLPPLIPLSEGMHALLDEVSNLSEMRQNIIHGVATDHPEGATQIKMVRLIRGEDSFSRHDFEVTSLEILDSAAKATNLGNRLLKTATALIEHLSPQR